MATIKDVAKTAGVSIGTVSNYINGTRPVKEETAKRIQKAIKKWGFTPNNFAHNLKANKNNEIGVVLPNTRDTYYSNVLAGIEKILTESNYYINLALTHDIPENETKVLERLLQKRISALIIVSCQPNKSAYFKQHFTKKNIPIVFIDRKIQDLDSHFIRFDNHKTMQYILQNITKRRKKIGLVVGSDGFFSEDACVDAYKQYHADAGLIVNNSLIYRISSSKEHAFRCGITLLQELHVDAVISSSKLIGSGIEEAARLMHRQVPEDLLLISLGQENWSSSISSYGSITTMRPAHLMGKKAAQLILKNLKSPLLFEKQEIILDDKIIYKDPVVFDRSQLPKQKIDRALEVLMYPSPNTKAVEKMLFDFTNKTGTRVNITTCNQQDLLDTMRRDANGQKHYDVYLYDIPWLDLLHDENVLTDIKTYLDANNFDTSIYIDGLLDKIGQRDGQYLGLPFFYAPQLLLYRKDLFDDPQLQSQFQAIYQCELRPPQNWLEFNAICEFFSHSHNPSSPVKYGTAIAAAIADTLIPEFLPRIWHYGGEIADEDNNPDFESPAFKKALQSFIQTAKYTPKDTLNYTIEDTVNDFQNGESAMLISYSAYVTNVNNHHLSKVAGKVGYDYLPGKASILGGWELGIAKHCDIPDQAFQFIAWACGSEMSRYFTILEGQSTLTEVYQNDELISLYPWLPLLLHIYPYCRERISTTSKEAPDIHQALYEKIMTALKEAITRE